MNWIKTHWLIKKLFSNYVWDIPNNENKVYLTFDDGPTPEITNWTLNQLKDYNAKATFFCIGDNVRKYPEIFKKVITDGHSIGNHTYNHLNGWKTSTHDYVKNTKLYETEHCKLSTEHCQLFRPPYGKIKPSQSKILRKLGYKIIMWDVISYDFDQTISKEQCLENVLKNVKSGSIIVFHDSKKAFQNLEYVLPRTLEFLNERGFVFEKLD
ncbi:polysaccharide deacetylase family protein [Flavobacterium aquatile]|uniref:Polysaccharide deacetylase n=1 Tax=Flavobacterium aquatile LMG 4008 = ATCC 11947 TaxID=1453498 RepID=A0A095SX81_9FLAO|nr:polysaccharide deacetylase family protein [Flavobacterium aquatile]KGD69157.1 polysaccharide deacetylase [Flavobacterium aquatile LMG 4008 = ATCC 11947]OXA65866.1 polysaccharide deacetylase family protein [Flavobacterium aquatile LMG 4008 = ATCC 11947]GEC79677.1 polysaccharide deacetylase [Flavobacterium aquatile]